MHNGIAYYDILLYLKTSVKFPSWYWHCGEIKTSVLERNRVPQPPCSTSHI